jgi:hypothetical protein
MGTCCYRSRAHNVLGAEERVRNDHGCANPTQQYPEIMFPRQNSQLPAGKHAGSLVSTVARELSLKNRGTIQGHHITTLHATKHHIAILTKNNDFTMFWRVYGDASPSEDPSSIDLRQLNLA